MRLCLFSVALGKCSGTTEYVSFSICCGTGRTQEHRNDSEPLDMAVAPFLTIAKTVLSSSIMRDVNWYVLYDTSMINKKPRGY